VPAGVPTVVPPELLELLPELLLEFPLELALLELLGVVAVEDPPPPQTCSNGTLKSSTQMRS